VGKKFHHIIIVFKIRQSCIQAGYVLGAVGYAVAGSARNVRRLLRAVLRSHRGE
jgi:hypothetical protein